MVAATVVGTATVAATATVATTVVVTCTVTQSQPQCDVAVFKLF